MKKVLLLGFGKIAYMPYMNFYLDTLKNKNDVEFDLIYWDRDGKPDETIPSQIKNAYKFEAFLEEQLPFKKKFPFFYRYRLFSLNILKRKQYDLIVILHSTPGLTLLDYLLKNYKGRYILDFRDISYEYILAYRKLVGKLVTGSAFTFVSSNAFRKFLPNTNNIFTIHNYSEDSLEHKEIRAQNIRGRDLIRISYWGLIRHVAVNKKILDALGNDPRFELHYYGRMQQDGRDIQKYAEDKNYSNVFFHGSYMPKDRYCFAKETDIIHNIYDLENKATTNAMGNKFYDGVIFSIPQICIKGSYMGEIITKRGVGIELNLEDGNLPDIIWDYYRTIDWKSFENNCNALLKEIVDEQCLARGKLLEVID